MMKRQHQYYKIKKKTGDPQHAKRYLNLKHQVQKRQQQAYWEYVGGIVTPQDKENEYAGMKRFWTYIKHRRSDNVCVSSLKSEGKLYSHPTDKADILNKQFQYEFSSSESISEEDFSKSYPTPTTEDQFPVIEDIDITLNGIVKLLKDWNPTKSSGPDNLSPKVLKEIANEVGPLLLLIYLNAKLSQLLLKCYFLPYEPNILLHDIVINKSNDLPFKQHENQTSETYDCRS